jgi:hypothetical protein
MSKSNLTDAKKAKNNEFYTGFNDIVNEVGHYKEHFKGKVVYCNCDDPEESNFWRYFEKNFEYFGLKKLIAVHYSDTRITYKLELTTDRNRDGKIDGKDLVKTPLTQNGDFRSSESIELLKEADIVVTNPPFSLFKEYIAQLVEYDKKFLIIGNNNALTYKEVFPLIKDNKIWLGVGSNLSMVYRSPYKNVLESNRKFVERKGFDPNTHIKVPAISWFTNLEHYKRNEEIILYKKYNEEECPKYDNYNAINVDEVKDIPVDYEGIIGVPITFLCKYNPEQFEILGQMATTKITEDNFGYPYLNGKKKYARILIKRK